MVGYEWSELQFKLNILNELSLDDSIWILFLLSRLIVVGLLPPNNGLREQLNNLLS